MKHIKMLSLSKSKDKWFAKLETRHWGFMKNTIIASGQLAKDGYVYTTNCSVVSDKPIDVELVKNAIWQQWRVFG